MKRASSSIVGLSLITLLGGGLACGSRVVDDAGSEGDTTGTQTETETETETDTAEIDCAEISPEDCFDYAQCVSSRVTEALLEGEPGDEYYYCSDILFTLACVDASCSPTSGVICEGGDPEQARWLVEGCIPPGWELCAMPTCG